MCVCVCIAKEAVWLATDQLLLSSQRRLNREIFVAIRPGAACKRGSHLCRWYRGSCLYSLLDFHAVTWYWPSLPAVLYTLKLYLPLRCIITVPSEKCWKCSNRSKLDWCCFAECHHPHSIFSFLHIKESKISVTPLIFWDFNNLIGWISHCQPVKSHIILSPRSCETIIRDSAVLENHREF